jgi:hypothetical protein
MSIDVCIPNNVSHRLNLIFNLLNIAIDNIKENFSFLVFWFKILKYKIILIDIKIKFLV